MRVMNYRSKDPNSEEKLKLFCNPIECMKKKSHFQELDHSILETRDEIYNNNRKHNIKSECVSLVNTEWLP